MEDSEGKFQTGQVGPESAPSRRVRAQGKMKGLGKMKGASDCDKGSVDTAVG